MINMVIKMVQTKFAAVLLGPSGIGLLGIYSSISSMVGIISRMGINTSGVRSIAESHGAGDEEGVARTVKSLRRTVWAAGALGMTIMIVGSVYISRISFKTSDHAIAVAALGIVILLNNIAIGQSCLLQGTRRINDLAMVSIIGALNGTIISIPCYYFWGQNGIVPSLILISTAALATSWWYARRVSLKPVVLAWQESREGAVELFKLGIPLMLAGLLTTLTDYLIRIFLTRTMGLESVGIWLAAFTLSGVLVNFVLTAMGADYYPRLTAVAHDNDLLKEAVNAQTEVALLLAVPGLAATIIFAPLVINIFYSGQFDAAADVLRWSVYGVFGRVISWPLGFIMLAKGMGRTFFCSETFANVIYLAAVWGCTYRWGLTGTGVAFMLMYVAYTILVYAIGYTAARIVWSRVNKIYIIFFGFLLAVIGLISARVSSPCYQYTINLILLVSISGYCLRRLLIKSGLRVNAILAKVGIGVKND